MGGNNYQVKWTQANSFGSDQTGSKHDPIIPARETETNKARVFRTFILICFYKFIESECKS